MLERQTLRLMPWTWAAPGDGKLPTLDRSRAVLAPESAAMLGFARLVRGPSWFGCGPQRIDVCETEDASHLLSLEQGWFSFGRWDFYDAERTRIGGMVGRHVLDERGFRSASIWQEGAALHAIRGRGGALLAWIETHGAGTTLLRFADDLDANPFMRMVLLAAALALSGP